MAEPTRAPASRYRRRILGLGALATGLLYVIGAPIFANRIEDDLERRVPTELADAGFGGISASFSGQDGTLRCERPLDDPEGALEAAYGVWGVRAIEMDRSCRVNQAPDGTDDDTTADATADDTAGATTGTEPDTEDGTADSIPTTTVPPAFASVADIVGSDPEFSLLSILLHEAELTSTLADRSAAPITLFAPTDAAFAGLSADAIAVLRSDPELLALLLAHHLVAGRLMSSELVDGPLETLAGDTVVVNLVGQLVLVDEATVTEPDIVAGNGVVHAIDELLIPDGVDLSPPEPTAEVSATLDDGTVTLVGVVATEVERTALVDAVTAATGAPPVDELTVDPDVGLDAGTAASLARLVTTMAASLVSGTAGYDGIELFVRGVYATEADRDAMVAVATEVGATAELGPRPEATDTEASELEAELNAFVAANPILFQPTSAVLSPTATSVIDRLAQQARQLTGIAITVEGHTDSDGDPAVNLLLSQRRAEAVRGALIERGLDPASITAEGFGSERPVLVGGVEDKDASRRVEFRVVAT